MLRPPHARLNLSWSSRLQRSCRAVVLIAVTLGGGLATAAVEWHPDLDTAHAAARISRRPVLAVFVATWDADTAAFEAACLGSPEAEAVLSACFEPVRVDIDDRPELARKAGVTHVPTACVLSADDTPLARFEMPDSPAAFVTAAILAAQRVAAEQEAAPAVVDAGRAPAGPDAAAQAGAAVFGAPVEPSPVDSRLPRGSLARVTAKVRGLSAFAMNQARPGSIGRPVALAPTPQPTIEPPAASARSSWPAETTLASPTAVAARSTIEPAAATPAPTATAPWLEAATPQPTPPAAQQPALAAAPATPPPAAATGPEPAAPEAPKASWQSQFIAALQKPFGWGAKSSDPPTVPPALPRGPLAAAVEPMAPAAAEAPPEADPHGSMPLGLEGYCPVTLVDRGSWKEGRAQWGARHRGRTYLFAGPDEQRTFLADPDRYAPALSGDDPVLALDRSSSTPGQRRYGVTYRSRMYLFASPETRQAFTADPDRYAARIALAERVPAAAGDTRRY